MSGKQISLFKSLPEQELQTYITQLEATKAASNGVFDTTAAQSYATAIQGLEAKQAALLLSTQGLTNAQIAETLAVNESNIATNYQAMVDAGLLKNRQKLTVAQVQENLQTVMGAEADTSAAMASLGLSASIEGQKNKTVKLTASKLKEAVATNVLTEAQAQEFAMRTGIAFAMQKQAASTLPKWIATLQAATKVIWEQVAATAAWLVTTPAGWATAAIVAIIGLVKIIDVLNVSVEEQREKLDDLKEGYSEIKFKLESLNSELSTTEQRMKELQSIESPTFVEKEEYNNLLKTNNELQRKIDLLELEERIKNQAVRKAFVATMEADTDLLKDKDDEYYYYTNIHDPLFRKELRSGFSLFDSFFGMVQAVPEDKLISFYEQYKKQLNELV